MSDEALEALLQDKRIIRHWGKIKSVRANAQAIYELCNEHDSVGQYLASVYVANRPIINPIEPFLKFTINSNFRSLEPVFK